MSFRDFNDEDSGGGHFRSAGTNCIILEKEQLIKGAKD